MEAVVVRVFVGGGGGTDAASVVEQHDRRTSGDIPHGCVDAER